LKISHKKAHKASNRLLVLLLLCLFVALPIEWWQQ